MGEAPSPLFVVARRYGPARPLSLRCLRAFIAERRLLALLHHAVANADELQDGSSASIPQPRLRQTDDAGVAALAIAKAGSQFREQDLDGPGVAKQLPGPAAGSHGRSNRRRPFVPLLAFAPLLPGVAVARGGGPVLLCGFNVLKRLAGQRDALLHERPDFLGLRQRGDDAAFDLRSVIVV